MTQSMEVQWLMRGTQRRAVALVLLQPLTASQIWKQACERAPKLQLRDVWFILRQLEARGLVQCFNPSLLNGKVFFWTEQGRAVAGAAFGNTIATLPVEDLNWNQYGRVARASVRRKVLEEISRPSMPEQRGKCVSEIRRQLLGKTPMELSRAIRAVKELANLKLIRLAGYTPKPKRKLYELTPAGRRIVETLKRQNEHGTDPVGENGT